MNHMQARFKKADLKRAVEAILALGLPVTSVKIAADGSIKVAITDTTKAPATELDEWMSRDAGKA